MLRSGDFVWPVPVLDGVPPEISSGFARSSSSAEGRVHLGSDILYKSDQAQTPDIPNNSKWFYMPRGVPGLAVGSGTVHKVAHGSRGWQVTIDHHQTELGPLATFYSHLASVSVVKGQDVEAGTRIGEIGDDPSNPGDPRHMHFEMWLTDRGSSREEWAVDPAPYLQGWRQLDAAEVRRPFPLEPLLALGAATVLFALGGVMS